MCVRFTGKWQKSRKDIIAYKVVRQTADGLLVSEFWPGQRSSQRDAHSTGEIAYYELDVLIEDDSQYGFYCYRNNPKDNRSSVAVLKVLIPKGSRYCLGENNYNCIPTINAMVIIPFEIVKDIGVPSY